MASSQTLIVAAGGDPAIAAAGGCRAAGAELSGLVTQPAHDGGLEVLYFCEAA